ncbi:hypothetical protein L5515_000956 [Caenorhabditis briggsae]|uniref:Uncharacterized protein n=1 Tax=Caenorhabditis briggsae TaxID=6238 RepID=A0AAE9E247_CAEBR|nr:hypothetical protein L5515_000956 [Caenorhabditis briggsae]
MAREESFPSRDARIWTESPPASDPRDNKPKHSLFVL